MISENTGFEAAKARIMPKVEAYLAGGEGEVEGLRRGLDYLHRLSGLPAKICKYVDLSNKVYDEDKRRSRKAGAALKAQIAANRAKLGL